MFANCNIKIKSFTFIAYFYFILFKKINSVNKRKPSKKKETFIRNILLFIIHHFFANKMFSNINNEQKPVQFQPQPQQVNVLVYRQERDWYFI